MIFRKYIALCTLLLLLFPSVSFSQAFKGGCMAYEYEGAGVYRILVDSYWEDVGSGALGLDSLSATGNPNFLQALSPKVAIGMTEMLPDGATRHVRQEARIYWPATGFYIVSFAGTGRVSGGVNFAASDNYGLSVAVNYDTTTVCNGITPAISGSANAFYDRPVYRFKAGAPVEFDFNVSSLPTHSFNFALAIPPGFPNTMYDQLTATGFSINSSGVFQWAQPQPGIWLLNIKVLEFCNSIPTGNCIARDILVYVEPTTSTNTAPVCDSDEVMNVEVGQNLSFQVNATDGDGDDIHLFADGLPLEKMNAIFGQIATGANASGLFSWTPPAGSEGAYRIQFLAVDNAASPLVSRQNLMIQVQPQVVTLETQCLITEYLPSGFSFFLTGITGMTSPEYTFEGLGGVFRAFDDSTATLTGTLVNKDSAHCRWEVDLKLSKRKDWLTWSALGRSFKGGFTAALANHPTWDFYELDSTSILCGLSNMAGDTLRLLHMPTNLRYGFQFGIGANDKTDDLGVSGWFTFTGSYSGAGDCNVSGDCRGRVPAISIKASLEGPSRNWADFMQADLNRSNLLPLHQPYNDPPYQYNGTEAVRVIPGADIIDWVLIQLRDPFNPGRVVHTQAAFLRQDMRVVGLEGQIAIELPAHLSGAYYVEICHRNHLDVMSRLPVIPVAGSTYFFDFTQGPGSIYRTSQSAEIPLKQAGKKSRWSLIAGDAMPDNVVNPLDVQAIGDRFSQQGLLLQDVDLNGKVDQKDAQKALDNYFIQSQTPE